ncbi:MAG: helix-turn-helix domain-containing protein [Clostridium sp.]
MKREISLGENVVNTIKSDNCKVYQIRNSTGEGIMTNFEIFPGVYLMFNDFHMSECISELQCDSNILCFDFCKEGRLEWEVEKDKFLYLESGDFRIDDRKKHKYDFSLPMSHYHGITVILFLDKARESLNKLIDGIHIDLENIKSKFLQSRRGFTCKADSTINHIFNELDNATENIRMDYYKIKILELLIYLKSIETPVKEEERSYFYRTQVAKVKAIKEFITNNLETHYTLEELSQIFEIPLTAMKKCFKGVYGKSIYSYLQDYRMNKAAIKILSSNDTIFQIATEFGYSNAGKFSTTFKKVIGKLPQEYRLENMKNKKIM